MLNLVIIWLLVEQGRAGVWLWEECQRVAKQQKRRLTQANRATRQKLAGLAKRPVCAACQAEEQAPEEASQPEPPPRWQKQDRRGAKQREYATWQYCTHPECEYYGWAGLNNLRANGTPNRGQGAVGRQWLCLACGQFVSEQWYSLWYRRRLNRQQISQVLQAVAEGLSYEAVGRLFSIEPVTVAEWVSQAGLRLGPLSAGLARDLRLEQLQLDDLYAKLRPRLGGLMPAVCWLYNAIDPVSKFWLGFEVGTRTLTTAQRLVHRVKQMLAPDHLPLIQTDGEASLTGAMLGHWGGWGQVETDQGPRRRWLPLPGLSYVQVVKRRLRRRLVNVSHRLVSGDEGSIRATLAAHGWSINTAFIERFNLTLRQHVPGLQRRALALARSQETLVAQLTLVQFYYNFCLPHTSLGTHQQPVTPAMALGLTDRVWRLEEGLMLTHPPRGSADWQLSASPA